MRILLTCVLSGVLVFCSPLVSAEDLEQTADFSIPTDVETDLPIGPILVGSMGAVMAVVGAGFAWQADQENDDYDRMPTAALADDVEQHALVANVLMFSGGALILGGLAWWLFTGDDEEPPADDPVASARQPEWRPLLGPGQAGVVVTF